MHLLAGKRKRLKTTAIIEGGGQDDTKPGPRAGGSEYGGWNAIHALAGEPRDILGVPSPPATPRDHRQPAYWLDLWRDKPLPGVTAPVRGGRKQTPALEARRKASEGPTGTG
jgi:hypothetical protein